MAVAAETFTSDYRFVDSIPEVATERELVRNSAEALLEARRHQHYAEHRPLPIDALSTAHEVLRTYRQFGAGSEEHHERSAALRLDCQRLVAEWYRKKKPEYFPPVRHVFDDEKEEFFSHGLSIRQMTENALVPLSNDPEEEARRVNERVEDATPQILRKLGKIALGEEAIVTFSECTDKAITDYGRDMYEGRSHAGYNGYVPEIEKIMIRMIRPDSASNDRFEEQVGVPGTYITHEVIQDALKRRGIDAAHLNKTGLHGAQLLVRDDLMEFVKLLDDEASEQWCTPIFMGEAVRDFSDNPDLFVKDYAGFRHEALARQRSLEAEVDTVAVFVLDLAEAHTDRRAAPALVEDFVKKLLLDLAKKDHSVAEQMFDTKTADGLRQVVQLERRGEYEQAFSLMQDIEQAAPGGGYCSGGSCGLESVDHRSDAGKSLASKLKAAAGDTIVKDKERACKCGSKSVVYAYNQRKVNKLCENCGAFESKVSIVAPTKASDALAA
ncbi:MAG: hypothetical protein ABIR37_03395 [Candidatus Saccharimonadales bacterium]